MLWLKFWGEYIKIVEMEKKRKEKIRGS